MQESDTITALATPPGEGGIGIIRISGALSMPILKEIYRTKSGQKIQSIQDHVLRYGKIVDAAEAPMDWVMIAGMKAPNTYTREDIAEIHCHGGMIPIQRIMDRILSLGARLAAPGEFTKRAFLNGRIDLAQAEALMDFIRSKTEASARASLSQMEGELSSRIAELRKDLIRLLARLEVTVDYPEEDIEAVVAEAVKTDLDALNHRINALLATADQGRLLREGIRAVILGKPNVGKSSLLNALLRENRAIVTEFPGTTRDVIEDTLNIRGILVRLMDTAGIRQTEDLVEQLGVTRSLALMDQADLILLILDASEPLASEDRNIIQRLQNQQVLVLLNKSDKPAVLTPEALRVELPDVKLIKTSMVTRAGIHEIEDYIEHMVFTGSVKADTIGIVTNQRHRQALLHARNDLGEALAALQQGMPPDMASIDIRGAAQALGEITGESVSEDVIERIFTEFCLGK